MGTNANSGCGALRSSRRLLLKNASSAFMDLGELLGSTGTFVTPCANACSEFIDPSLRTCVTGTFVTPCANACSEFIDPSLRTCVTGTFVTPCANACSEFIDPSLRTCVTAGSNASSMFIALGDPSFGTGRVPSRVVTEPSVELQPDELLVEVGSSRSRGVIEEETDVEVGSSRSRGVIEEETDELPVEVEPDVLPVEVKSDELESFEELGSTCTTPKPGAPPCRRLLRNASSAFMDLGELLGSAAGSNASSMFIGLGDPSFGTGRVTTGACSSCSNANSWSRDSMLDSLSEEVSDVEVGSSRSRGGIEEEADDSVELSC